jgi:hypothetical protein
MRDCFRGSCRRWASVGCRTYVAAANPYADSNSSRSKSDPHDDSLDETDNRIDNVDPKERQAQLKTIIARGLQKMDGERIKCTIAGHEFDLQESIAKGAKVVQGMKRFVDEAVKASPEASLAWAGVCAILPLLTKPSTAKQANMDGFAYVTARMSFYVKLEPLLLPKDQDQTATVPRDLKGEFEDHIVDLYQHILDFQLKSVLRFYRSWRGNLPRDLIDYEDWKGMLSKVQGLEATLDKDFKKINDAVLRETLEKLDKGAGESLKTMRELLSVVEQLLQLTVELRDNSSKQLQVQENMKHVIPFYFLRSFVPDTSAVIPSARSTMLIKLPLTFQR